MFNPSNGIFPVDIENLSIEYYIEIQSIQRKEHEDNSNDPESKCTTIKPLHWWNNRIDWIVVVVVTHVQLLNSLTSQCNLKYVQHDKVQEKQMWIGVQCLHMQFMYIGVD